MAEPFHLCRPVAGDGRPVRHDVEAADLRARRRPVAAPAAGLPEQAGGERNWDYRYTWIRDGSFSIYALLGLGYVEEAAAFGGWLRDRAEEQAGDASGPLKIIYRVDGTSDLAAETLDHFEGWRGSRPVRIGNGAADQLQLDIYGEAADAIFLADSHGLQPAHQGWTALADITGSPGPPLTAGSLMAPSPLA